MTALTDFTQYKTNVSEFISTLLQIAVTLPFLTWAIVRTTPKHLDLITACLVLFFMYSLLLILIPDLAQLSLNSSNWAGRLIGLGFSLIVAFLFTDLSRNEFGLTHDTATSAKPVVLIFLLTAVLLGLGCLAKGATANALETIAYQVTMPGLDEEIFFRAVLLTLFNQSFGRSWTVFGAQMGWGIVITSILFGAAHGIHFAKDGLLQFDAVTTLATGAIGFVLGWARERTGSVVPSIIGHNFINSLGLFF
jgi:uncharacterized protein